MINDRTKTQRFLSLLFVAILCAPVSVLAQGDGGNHGLDGHSTAYYQHHTFKVVFEVPANPKLWPAVALVVTHNLVSMMGHNVRVKAIMVAPGPAIHYFMNQYNAADYKALERLHELGVRFVACNAALVAFHVKRSQLFPFVGVAYPSGVIYLLKKQAQGYSYYVWS
ncbi:MAG: DsrE family protein [Acidiferrobacterales bacterium]